MSMISLLFAAMVLMGSPVQTQSPVPSTPHHEANFDSERKQADELFTSGKVLDTLPLYEDLCKQDPTVAVFAERHGAALLAKEATMSGSTTAESNDRLQVHLKAINELKRARSLGDNTDYVRVALNADSKTFVGAVQTAIPLSVGYTYHGKPEAQAAFNEGETAFARGDWVLAASKYTEAATADPTWYDAALFTGDAYFRGKDTANAGVWFAKAIAIDPDRETAYRYWGDALFRAGDRDGAREKFVQAVVAEPYGIPAMTELAQWGKVTGHQMVMPNIVRPEFTTPEGKLAIDPTLAASTKDGRSSWIIYQQYRVDHGARVLNQTVVAGGWDKNAVITPSGYRHTIAEEHAALRAMLKDIKAKLKDGTVAEADLDVSIRNIRSLEQADMLGAWIAINAADTGIHSDYPAYRSNHRKHLVDYVNGYLIR
jgi:tetratricopeptide (TPR) repeat protein